MRKKMSLEEAIAMCTDLVKLKPDEENIPIGIARDRVTSVNICADSDVPNFDRSRVDGYAVTAADYNYIRSEHEAGVDYEVIDTIAAGSSNHLTLIPGKTARIMTGALLPHGTAVVIKQEYAVTTGHNLVRLAISSNEKNWCESHGSILKRGQQIAVAGEVLDEIVTELLASSGVSSVKVYCKPRVYIISTGTELVMPGRPAELGQIYNSNFTMLIGKLRREGCEVIQGSGDLKDNLAEISLQVQKGLNLADLVIITGGASEGDFDLVPAALHNSGCRILCGQLDMKPGTHTTLATKGNSLLFNLPGNPGAGSLLFEVLISPVLRKLKGMRTFNRVWFNIPLAQPCQKYHDCRVFCRGELIDSQNGPEAMALDHGTRITGVAPLVLDIAPGMGRRGDMVRALLV